MFAINGSRVAPAVVRSAEQPSAVSTEEARPAASPFAESRFDPTPAKSATFYPTNADVLRPTPATVVNITTGDRQPLNPAQMSNEQGISFVQDRLAALGFPGSLTAGNQTSPATGPFRIDYAGDDRRHWDIGGMNVGLVLSLYANNPPEVADRMLACDMKYASSRPRFDDVDGPDAPPPVLAAPSAAAFAPLRVQPGTDFGAVLRNVAPAGRAYVPTVDEVNRPTSAASVNVLDGSRQPLNPAQMSTQQGVDFVRERLAALGYRGAGVVSNQTAPTTGPFGIDYGTDDRRHWDIDGMNVGLTLQLYATNPPEVADRMLAAIINQH
jgi:hypothetical protein